MIFSPLMCVWSCVGGLGARVGPKSQTVHVFGVLCGCRECRWLGGNAPEDHGSGLLNGFQTLAQEIGVSVPKLDVVGGMRFRSEVRPIGKRQRPRGALSSTSGSKPSYEPVLRPFSAANYTDPRNVDVGLHLVRPCGRRGLMGRRRRRTGQQPGSTPSWSNWSRRPGPR
jgi:hypothetical protein